jgi:ABC-type sugar transport system ATPase subunit
MRSNATQSTEATDRQAEDDEQPAKIHVENIEKRFGRVVALDDITFSVRRNEILAIVGDNGAGKSTMMNVLSGVYTPTDGTVYYDGEAVSFATPEQARKYGIETVYQHLALMDDLDVATNIFMEKFPKRGIGPFEIIDWKQTYEAADELLTETLNRSIDPRAEVAYLSGGQRQLVAISRALAFDPEVIILDEPTSALSVEATDLVHDTVRQLKQQGRTLVIVSHSIDEIRGLADRIAVLYQGILADVVDTPDAVDDQTLKNLISTGSRE